MTIQATDLFLVNRNDQTTKVQHNELMAKIQDDDLMILQRSNQTYKITGMDLKNSFVDDLIVSISLSTSTVLVGTTVTASVSTSGGEPPYVKTYQWKSKTPDDTVTDIVDATDISYTATESDVGNRLACAVTVTDAYGNVLTVTSGYTNPVTEPTPQSETAPAGTRFNKFAESYLKNTFTQGDQGHWTFSGWVKRCSSGKQRIFNNVSSTSTGKAGQIGFNDQNQLEVTAGDFPNAGGSYFQLITEKLFLDVGAWYHICISFNTDEGSSADVCKIYINGTRVPISELATQANPTVGTPYYFNVPGNAQIGSWQTGSNPFDGYMADIYWVDGQSLLPTDFAETSSDGMWQPKPYAVPSPSTVNWLSGQRGGVPFSNEYTFDNTGVFCGHPLRSIGATSSSSGPNKYLLYFPEPVTYTSVTIYSAFDVATDCVLVNDSFVTTSSGQTLVGTGSASMAVGKRTWLQTELQSGGYGEQLISIGVTSASRIFGIEIDGVLLTISGHNSSHLNMDPSIPTGTVWSNYLVPVSEWYTPDPYQQYGPISAFNADNTELVGSYSSVASQTLSGINFIPDTPIAFTDKVEIHGGPNGGSQDVSYNGGASQGLKGGWNTIATGPAGVLSSIVMTLPGNASCTLLGIKIDGKLLVDVNAIGYDSSGLGNDWFTEGLVSDQSGVVYSEQPITTSGTLNASPDKPWNMWNGGSGLTNVTNFDTSGVTTCNGDGAGAWFRWTWADAIPAKKVELFCMKSGAATDCAINGISIIDDISISQWTWIPVDLEASGISTFTTLEIGWSVYVGGCKVDGVLLTDPSACDLLSDSPSTFNNGVYGVGNYATLNKLSMIYPDQLSNGNLELIGPGSGHVVAPATIGISEGSYYWEATCVDPGTTYVSTGMMRADVHSLENLLGIDSNSGDTFGVQSSSGRLYYNGNTVQINASELVFGAGDVLGWWWNNGDVYFYKGGLIANNGDPVITGLTGTWMPAYQAIGNSNWQWQVNFGQRPWKLPWGSQAGASTISSYGMPTPPVIHSYEGNEPVIYNGAAGSLAIDSLSMSPGLIWLKDRGGDNAHVWTDQIRGTGEIIYSNSTSAEDTNSTTVTSFDSNGFTLGDSPLVNTDGGEYVSWNFYAGNTNNNVATNTLSTSSFNADQDWSADVSGYQSIDNAFNGNIQDYATCNANTSIINFTTGISGRLKMFVATNQPSDQDPAYVTFTCLPAPTTGAYVQTTNRGYNSGAGIIDFGDVSGVTQIVMDEYAGSIRGIVYGIELNGRLLITTNTPPITPSVDCVVRANPDTGFSIVNWAGGEAGNDTGRIAHGLGKAPAMIIMKCLNTVGSWSVFHEDLGMNQNIVLESTALAYSSSVWRGGPFSDYFDVSGQTDYYAQNNPVIAYCFAEVEGYSSISWYRGNTQNGPMVNCGFQPAFVMVKSWETEQPWVIADVARNTYNTVNRKLAADSSTYENNEAITGNVAANNFDFYSNGFKLRTTNSATNQNNIRYLYAAFAEHPLKYASAH